MCQHPETLGNAERSDGGPDVGRLNPTRPAPGDEGRSVRRPSRKTALPAEPDRCLDLARYFDACRRAGPDSEIAFFEKSSPDMIHLERLSLLYC
jgi:hypothetical protein